nr:hypothetical protein [Tanacetum cinerariifolium]
GQDSDEDDDENDDDVDEEEVTAKDDKETEENGKGADLSEMELKKILIEKMEGN